MATHRYVSTNMWTDPWFQSLDPAQKFLYLYCITNHCTNIAGLYYGEIPSDWIKAVRNKKLIDKVIEKFSCAILGDEN